MLSLSNSGTFRPERGNRTSIFVWFTMLRTTPAAYAGESWECIQQSLRGLLRLAATRLLYEPFAEAVFNVFLRKSTVRLRVFQAATHFVQHIKVVLDVLDRAVLRKPLE